MNSAPKWPWILPAALGLLTVAAYIPTIHAGFVFDDSSLITDNPLIKDSNGLYHFWFTTKAPDYYPLTSTLFWFEWRWWGDNPMGYHVVNVLLHAANAVLIWVVLRQLKIPCAWLAALIFGLHPVNVATVAWVSEQKNTLSMLFYLVAILLYLRFDKDGSWRWYAASLLAFLLALFSKSAVAILPVVLFACVWWIHGRLRYRDILRSGPFFALSVIMGLVTIWFQWHRAMHGSEARTVGFAFRLAAAGWVPWFYLDKALLPVDLTVVYPNWRIDISQWVSYVPGLIVIGSLVLFWRKRDTWGRALFFGWGYFVVTLFPVLGFFDQAFFRYSLVADHWQYYSIIGIIALAVAGMEKFFVGLNGRGGQPAAAVATGIVLALLAGSTWKRGSVYANNVTLWRDNVAKAPVPWSHNLLGCALTQTGEFEEAIREFQEALRMDPAYPEAQSNLGDTLLRAGNVDEAMTQLRQTLQRDPRNPQAHNNLGNALQQIGRLTEAREHFEQALRLMPDYPEAYNSLGINLGESGKYEEAIAQFEQALRIRPVFAEAQYNWGNALINLHKPAESLPHYKLALQYKPDYPDAQHNMGVALTQLGRMAESVGYFEAFLRAHPNDAPGRHELGVVLLQAGRYPEAIVQLEQALRIEPDFPEAHYDLGIALEQSGRYQEAIAHYQQALRIRPDYREAEGRLSRLQAN